MGDDVIIGYDGKPRCAWARAGDTALGRYHDEVWGTPTYDESALFEALTLGVFEAGLSWSIVFGKRDAFRRAFHGFDIAQVAAMTERDVDRLLQDPSIIRNRAKVQATVENARAMRSASPSLAALARSYESTRKRAPRSLAELPRVDTAGGRVRQGVEVTGIPLRGAHERVRVHAERRRGQRPHPRLLPSHRLHLTSDQGPTPMKIIRRGSKGPRSRHVRSSGASEYEVHARARSRALRDNAAAIERPCDSPPNCATSDRGADHLRQRRRHGGHPGGGRSGRDRARHPRLRDPGQRRVGRAVPRPLLPGLWRTIGGVLPPGASVDLARAALYFDGSRIAGPILVLAGWAAFGTALVIALGGRIVNVVEAEIEAAAGAAV